MKLKKTLVSLFAATFVLASVSVPVYTQAAEAAPAAASDEVSAAVSVAESSSAEQSAAYSMAESVYVLESSSTDEDSTGGYKMPSVAPTDYYLESTSAAESSTVQESYSAGELYTTASVESATYTIHDYNVEILVTAIMNPFVQVTVPNTDNSTSATEEAAASTEGTTLAASTAESNESATSVNASTASAAPSSNPETGDRSNVVLWAALLCISVLALGTITLKRRMH